MTNPLSSLGIDVSRETYDDLVALEALIKKWSAKINLISKHSVSDIWDRHILDSAQLWPLAPPCARWIDLGSGGGLPALVIAILAKELRAELHLTMIESDQRKCTFLRTAIREFSLNASVIADRIENVPQQNANVISARALTDLDGLLAFSFPHLVPHGQCLFLKGESWASEVKTAQSNWRFSYKAHKSLTNPKAAILIIKDVERAK